MHSLDLGRDPPPPLRLELGVAERNGERLSVCDERSRWGELLRVHLCGELGRPVVGVDEAVDVAAEAEAEQDVGLERAQNRGAYLRPSGGSKECWIRGRA